MEEVQGYSIAYRGLKKTGPTSSASRPENRCSRPSGVRRSRTGSAPSRSRSNVARRCFRPMSALRAMWWSPATAAWKDCRIPIDVEGRLLVKFSDEPRASTTARCCGCCRARTRWIFRSTSTRASCCRCPTSACIPRGQCDPEMLKRFRIVSDEEFSAIENRAEEHGVSEGAWAKLAALRERMEADEAEEKQERHKVK